MSRIPVLGGSFWRPGYYAERWGLQAYWNLQDVNDAWINGLTLTNVNAVTFTAGLIGNSATFVGASSQRLTRANNTIFQPGNTPFAFAFWYNLTTHNDAQILLSKINAGVDGEYAFDTTGGSLRFLLATNGVNRQVIRPWGTAGQWHFVFAFWNGSSISLQIDNGTALTAAAPGSVTSSTNVFSLGGHAGASDYITGRLASCAYMKSDLIVANSAEINTTLYAAGSGRLWPF